MKVDGWTITYHALQQAIERGVAVEELRPVLRCPDTTLPDVPGHEDVPGFRRYVGGGLVLAVNELSRQVITVMVHGGAKDDWEDVARKRRTTVPAPDRNDDDDDARHRRRRRAPAAVRVPGHRNDPIPTFRVKTSHTLDVLHPAVRAAVEDHMRRHNLTVQDLRITSPTRVEFTR